MTTLEFIEASFEIIFCLYFVSYIRNIIALFFDYFDKGWFEYESVKDEYVSTWRFPKGLEKFEKDRIKIWQTPKSWKKLKMCLIQPIKEFYGDINCVLCYLIKTFSKKNVGVVLKCIFLDVMPNILYALLILIWCIGVILWLKG
jgi:hypothetical protein